MKKFNIRILDKYIFKETFYTFLFGVCAFASVFISSGTLFRIARFITEYGASMSSVLKIFVFSLPGVVIWTFPMSMLLASLLAFGRLSASSEINAMKSCGISFLRIATPALVLGILVSIFSVWFNEYIVPWANGAYANVLHYEIRKNTAPKSQDHIIIKDIHAGKISRLIYARRFDGTTQQMQGVTLEVFQDGKVSHVENAEYAEWKGDNWLMHNGIIYDINSEDKASHTVRFEKQLLPVNESPTKIIRDQKAPEEMTIRELKETIKILGKRFVNAKKFETEMYQRFTVPMASFIFTLVGVPLALQPNRNSSSMGFVTSLIIIFIYYALMTLCNALANGGVVVAWLAVWMPNIIGAIAGAYLMWRATK